jgi:hypothetical protein
MSNSIELVGASSRVLGLQQPTGTTFSYYLTFSKSLEVNQECLRSLDHLTFDINNNNGIHEQ